LKPQLETSDVWFGKPICRPDYETAVVDVDWGAVDLDPSGYGIAPLLIEQRLSYSLPMSSGSG
jgi:hypothetical protein